MKLTVTLTVDARRLGGPNLPAHAVAEALQGCPLWERLGVTPFGVERAEPSGRPRSVYQLDRVTSVSVHASLPPGQLVGTTEVGRMAGVARAVAANWTRRYASFPAPVPAGYVTANRGRQWRRSEVAAWLRSNTREVGHDGD